MIREALVDLVMMRHGIGRAAFALAFLATVVSAGVAVECLRLVWLAEVDARLSAFLAIADPSQMDISQAKRDARTIFLTQIATLAPFAVVVAAVTAARCRSMGVRRGWTVLLAVPLVNLAFLAALVVLPERARREERAEIVDFSGTLR